MNTDLIYRSTAHEKRYLSKMIDGNFIPIFDLDRGIDFQDRINGVS